MQQVFELFGFFLREGGGQPMRARRALLQDGQARGIETMDHVAHRLVVAAQLVRNLGGALPSG